MNAPSTGAQQERLKKAAVVIRRLEERLASLEQVEQQQHEPLAIVGMGCRLPGGADAPRTFWELLDAGRDAVQPLEPRWALVGSQPGAGVPRWAGLLTEPVDGFDAAFFGVPPREARSLDPQHRLLLEVAWEALEDAGIPPGALSSSRTGVFVGACSKDYSDSVTRQPNEEQDAYSTTGNLLSIAAGRLSYALGLQGPCLTIDTACSSSLVAVHLACRSLRSGESDLALVGGVNMILSPVLMEGLARTQALSPDGRCRTFDASANGFVRGEGCGLVVLKRLSDARRDGNRIWAIIRGSAINQDGRSTGLTAPNVLAQQALLRDALRDARVEADAIGYVETHGTGTSLGDPIEVQALRDVLGGMRPDGSRCVLGALKSNIGHLEAAAGIAGLIKAVLALEHGRIPKNLHFRRLNAHIELEGSALILATEPLAWPRTDRPRMAGVSSFGLSGTNAHVVLEEAPLVEPAIAAPPRGAELMVLSARSPKALEAVAARLGQYLETQPEVGLGDLAFSLATTRGPMEHRLAVTATSREALRATLVAVARGQKPQGVSRDTSASRSGKLAFLFTGQGSQVTAMGRGLSETWPVFREALERCFALFDKELEQPLREVMWAAPGSAHAALLDQTVYTQASLFSLEYALAALWRSWCVVPELVAGHSLGELVAACVAGVFSLEDAVRLVGARGRLMQALPSGGAMVSIAASEGEVAPALAPQAGKVSIAAVNGPEQVVISGDEELVQELAGGFAARGVKTKRLRVSHAFHSPLMAPMLDAFRRVAESITYQSPSLPLVSNVSGRLITEEAREPGYWVRHVHTTVRMADGVRALREAGATTFVELGPKPTLLGLVTASLPQEQLALVASLRTGRDEAASMLDALGALWCAGFQVDWAGVLGAGGRRVSLPNYPWQRERYWLEVSPPTLTQAPASHSSTVPPPALLPQREPTAVRGNAPSPAPAREATLLTELSELIRGFMGDSSGEFSADHDLFQLGVDSLALFSLRKVIERRFGVLIPINAFEAEVSTVRKMALFLDQMMPPEPTPQETPTLTPDAEGRAAQPLPLAEDRVGSSGGLERIVADQLTLLRTGGGGSREVMERIVADQLALLRQVGGEASSTGPRAPAPKTEPRPVPTPGTAAPVDVPGVPGAPKAFVPYRRINTHRDPELDARQGLFLKTLIGDFTTLTPGSKRLADETRPTVANNRAVAGFRSSWKEMIYPLHVTRAEGSKVWDVDGNEYLDMTMGFGVFLFGHRPAFVAEAVAEELNRGAPLGPMTPLPGEVAMMLAEATGVERVAFYNTGTEAVMVALRLARAVTGRSKVVTFAGSYHGTFDGVLAVSDADDALRGLPLAPGTTRGMAGDTIVLEYGAPASLEVIRRHATDIAAVLVEPVQSRRPDHQPRSFLEELRGITADAGVALIFDEVITGFRTGPGGAQAHFGIRADLSTYGKVIGGGLPIGIVAGARRFMDAVDGGAWRFGDDSGPKVQNTFVAGTFCHHPLSLAAARAVLRHLRDEGPSLQRRLNDRTAALASELNAHFVRVGAPVRVVHFGSLFRLELKGDWELLYYRLLSKGVYVWEGRNLFLSTAHTEEDIRRFSAALAESIDEMMAAGFAPPPGPRPSRSGPAPHALPVSVPPPALAGGPVDHPTSFIQRGLYFQCQFPDGEMAYHNHGAWEVRGALDATRVEACFREILQRHEALRSTFVMDDDGRLVQRVHPAAGLELEHATGTDIDGWLRRFIRPFNLASPPLLRVGLLGVEEERYVLAFDMHHITADGTTTTLVVREFIALYMGEALSPVARQGHEHATWEQKYLRSGAAVQERYWRERFSNEVPRLELWLDFPRPAVQRFEGGEIHLRRPSRQLRIRAREYGASVYMVLFAACHTLLQRLTGQRDITLGTAQLGRQRGGFEDAVGMFVNALPVRVSVGANATFSELLAEVKRRCLEANEHQDFPLGVILERLKVGGHGYNPFFDVMFSYEHAEERMAVKLPGLTLREVPIARRATPYDLNLEVIEAGGTLDLRIAYCAALWKRETVERYARYFGAVLDAIEGDPARPLGELPPLRIQEVSLLSEEEQRQLLLEWNDTAVDFPREQCVHELFEAQVERTPDAVALIFGQEQLTYTQLNVRANQLAHRLRGLGVGPETLVALCLERSIDMMVGLMGILKAGGAYVPLDPTYPEERLAHMLEDSGARVLIMGDGAQHLLSRARVNRVWLDAERVSLQQAPGHNLASGARGHHLAYILYTSGSTGRPKGTEVTHRNVANFFTGMDERLGREPGTWLAVTSISFDISVLELFWTLARGFRVVLQSPLQLAPTSSRGPAPRLSEQGDRGIDFSLFYFASATGGDSSYELLMEGARFADENDFLAVWTPERHFHDFGGLYPNPSVVSAALATATKRVGIRAGSVVLPLHNPIRVAEEWAIVDNLSQGRVALSFASGWHADDFTLMPQNYAARRQLMIEGIDTVRSLWRGETLDFVGGTGQATQVRTLPRPVQAELPYFLTAAGNPETYRLAGERGAGLLTHLLGQDLNGLEKNLRLYREAWAAAGHTGPGHVTLMMHTFVAHDEDFVQRTVPGPLTEYLRRSADLMKAALGELAGSTSFEGLPQQDMDFLLSKAVERFIRDIGLFGTPESCLSRIEQLKALGVDEVACLIDFGVETRDVLASLVHLNKLRESSNARPRADESIADNLRRHRVTHLQCTPSLARMLVTDPDTFDALRGLRKLMLGGEALPPSIIKDLASLPCELHNMYGPTETTIWSSTSRVHGEDAITIGKPIANTQFYILDERKQPVPVGVIGELYIGGEGLARGYHDQPALTVERFLPDPFSGCPGARMYRTGDHARFLPDGHVKFFGRVDQQMKIRGHRIEVEEIERSLAQHPRVRDVVVVVREVSSGDKRLIAYMTPASGHAGPVSSEDLAAFLRKRLPAPMVPSDFVMLEQFPQTANGKVDRKALPAVESLPLKRAQYVAPSTPTELRLTQIWEDLLQKKPIGIQDGFFALGGHSLLAVRLIARIRKEFSQEFHIASLLTGDTIETQARMLDANRAPKPAQTPLIMLRQGDRAAPLFLMHPTGGDVSCYGPLATQMESGRPVYALRAVAPAEGCETLEQRAAWYLAQVRAVQPRGPYLLGGWSTGGIFAYEMARQLCEAGEEIERLVLLDSWTPEAYQQHGADDVSLLLWFASDVGGEALVAALKRPLLDQMAPGERLRHVLELAKGAVEQDLDIQALSQLYRDFERNARIILGYEPKPCPLKTTVLRAGEALTSGLRAASSATTDMTPAWQRLVQGPCESIDVPGSHSTMLREPHLSSLVKHLESVLEGHPVARS
ncbi:type I polyketide synthase [Corallococcus terminator]|uniref:Aminotransferase class III-fold pyridoxal phosphate-dependent enzyme n=1 Tax=Corallococcus terminator TaxID=2316733 RepID=A0A3A8JEG0_9BACT|nr:type I polyketide synthase [Corallococcus terminator]RKG93765.1 aminotransferase class III-fold pyridoxal phosphate-dependent enzyme [Corallococcus terminator]